MTKPFEMPVVAIPSDAMELLDRELAAFTVFQQLTNGLSVQRVVPQYSESDGLFIAQATLYEPVRVPVPIDGDRSRPFAAVQLIKRQRVPVDMGLEAMLWREDYFNQVDDTDVEPIMVVMDYVKQRQSLTKPDERFIRPIVEVRPQGIGEHSQEFQDPSFVLDNVAKTALTQGRYAGWLLRLADQVNATR
ncbi:MAG: hypothetical protein JWL85_513 [Candidatus Saccharibacteria bacterium]|nr:hypothetical protein [Candidatus Saccharibacteria bacterium]